MLSISPDITAGLNEMFNSVLKDSGSGQVNKVQSFSMILLWWLEIRLVMFHKSQIFSLLNALRIFQFVIDIFLLAPQIVLLYIMVVDKYFCFVKLHAHWLL